MKRDGKSIARGAFRCHLLGWLEGRLSLRGVHVGFVACDFGIKMFSRYLENDGYM